MPTATVVLIQTIAGSAGKKSNGNDESDDDMDYGPVIERPEEAVELSDDDGGEWRGRPLNGERSRNLVHKNHFNYRMRSRVLSVKLSLRRSTGDRTRFTSNHRRLRRDHSPGASSMPATLTRSGSQHGVASSSMLSRQSSKTFLGKASGFKGKQSDAR